MRKPGRGASPTSPGGTAATAESPASAAVVDAAALLLSTLWVAAESPEETFWLLFTLLGRRVRCTLSYTVNAQQ